MEPTIGTITGIMKPGVDLVIAFPEAEYIVEFVSQHMVPISLADRKCTVTIFIKDFFNLIVAMVFRAGELS